ncbi:hypothetical protein TRFO_20603 [Tritrichomonas foetus]|uniref:Uncharacterized protein n=1 Tax=Tritrichomonas foetus TaxID=1144522 RepID=A0A1J4KFD5_9EUKA|nr:hypothetical protein TRFO_20603 [Tritrichomonas foetus]|eukprot:OHT10151.1 hypothetical protein TRFO_20603 [Tritrichomonas foetus]
MFGNTRFDLIKRLDGEQKPVMEYKLSLSTIFENIQELCFLCEQNQDSQTYDMKLLYNFSIEVDSTIKKLCTNETNTKISQQRKNISNFNNSLKTFIKNFHVFTEKLFENVRNELKSILDGPLANTQITDLTNFTTVEQWTNIYEEVTNVSNSKLQGISPENIEKLEKVVSKGLAASKLNKEFQVLIKLYQNLPPEPSKNEQSSIENQKLLHQIQEMQKEMKEKDFRIRNLEIENRNMKNEISEIHEKFTNAETNYKIDIEQINLNYDKLKTRYNALKVTSDEYSRNFEKVNLTNKELTQKIKELEEKLKNSIPKHRFEKYEKNHLNFLQILQKYTV